MTLIIITLTFNQYRGKIGEPLLSYASGKMELTAKSLVNNLSFLYRSVASICFSDWIISFPAWRFPTEGLVGPFVDKHLANDRDVDNTDGMLLRCKCRSYNVGFFCSWQWSQVRRTRYLVWDMHQVVLIHELVWH